MLNKIYEIKLSSVSIGGNYCKNFEVVFEEPYCAGIKCEYNNATNVIVVSVPPDCDNSCIYANIKCLDTSDCTFCPDSERIKICPCTVDGDCQDCESCVNGLCITECLEGEFCKGDVCIECDDANPCPNGQVCNNGTCECPPGKPFVDKDGNCVECIHGTVQDCKVCDKGVWVDKECAEGVCDPETDDCVDCLKSGDCEKNNECCKDKDCVCCPGFVRNLVTGECESAPECTKDSDCEECEICTDLGCQPVTCPDGFICVGGDCLPECDCASGGCEKPGTTCVPHPIIVDKCYCINCTGIPCDECNDTFGCGCIDGENCVPDNSCDPSDIDLEWVFTPGEQGAPNGGANSLSLVSTSITPGEQIFNEATQSTYRNYSFAVTIGGNSPTGQWYYTNGLENVPVGGFGNTIVISLEDLGQNMGFFALKYVDNDPCTRTITIPFAVNTDIENPLQAPTNGWRLLPTDSSGGCNAFTGGTAGHWSLCVTGDSEYVIDPSSLDINTTDSISVTLSPQVGKCSKATITGCGEFTGTVELECKGVVVTATLPLFEVDTICCDPTDPACVTTGEPCNTDVLVNIPIKIYSLFGTTNNGATSEAVGIIDVLSLVNSGTLDATSLLSIASQICWSSTANPQSAFGEIVTEGNGFGAGYNNPFEFKFDYASGTCLQVGESCEIRKGCEVYSGEECIDACRDFEVLIVESGEQDGEYLVIPSNFALVSGSEDWRLIASTNLNGTNPFYTGTINPGTLLPPTQNGGSPGVSIGFTSFVNDVLTVQLSKVKYLDVLVTNFDDCIGQETLTLPTYGCRDVNACNYDPDADFSRRSDCQTLVGDITYNCVTGLQATASLNSDGGSIAQSPITIFVNGISRPVGYSLAEGTYTVYVSNGTCDSRDYTLVVNCCEINPVSIAGLSTTCDNGGGGTDIDFTVGGGTGTYDIVLSQGAVTVDTLLAQSAGALSFTISPAIETEEVYTITATDTIGCTRSQTFTAQCCTALSSILLDNGSGDNPSLVVGVNELSNLVGGYPAGTAADLCGVTTTDFAITTTPAIVGDNIEITIVEASAAGGNVTNLDTGLVIPYGVPTTIEVAAGLQLRFNKFLDGTITIRYCGNTYVFTLIDDCSPQTLTDDEFFIANEDANGSTGFIKVTMNNTATSIINLETLYQTNRFYPDIAFLNNTLYTIGTTGGAFLQDVTELGVGLNISYDISPAVNGGTPLDMGACAIPGSNNILLVAYEGSGAQIGYTNILTQTNTFVEEITDLYGGYDIVVNGNDVYISGIGPGGPADYKVYKMALIGNVLQPGSVEVVNTVTKNIKGSTLLTPSGGGVRYLGAGNEATPTTNTSIYFTTDIENNAWVLQTNSGPIQGSISGMASKNG